MWGVVDDNESIAAIRQAIDCGVNLIDTAAIYGQGHSEEIVGKAVAGLRDRVVIATKCGLLPPTKRGELPRRCLSHDSIIRECENSLRRLRTDVIDLYQCHWSDPETPLRETMRAMTTLPDQGKIRTIGVSNFGCEQLATAREFGPVHCVQPHFSLLHRRPASDLIPYCQEHDIALIAYGPLAKGLLTGKFDESSTFEDVRATDPDFTAARYRSNLATVAKLKEIATRYDKTVAQLALGWVVTYPGVTSAIVGAKRPSQVIELSYKGEAKLPSDTQWSKTLSGPRR